MGISKQLTVVKFIEINSVNLFFKTGLCIEITCSFTMNPVINVLFFLGYNFTCNSHLFIREMHVIFFKLNYNFLDR